MLKRLSSTLSDSESLKLLLEDGYTRRSLFELLEILF